MYLSVIRIKISEPNENCTDIRQNEIQRHSQRAKPAAFLLVYKFFTFVYTVHTERMLGVFHANAKKINTKNKKKHWKFFGVEREQK